jgi:N-acetylglutamate synthase-like GNAT family acetyltransferase
MKIRKVESRDIHAVAELIRRNFDEVMIKYHSVNIIEEFKNHNTAYCREANKSDELEGNICG